MKRFLFVLVLLVAVSFTVSAQQLGPVIASDSILVRATNWGDKVNIGSGKSARQIMVRIQVLSGNGVLGIAREDDTLHTQVARCVVGETGVYIPMIARWVRFKNLTATDTCLVYREIY